MTVEMVAERQWNDSKPVVNDAGMMVEWQRNGGACGSTAAVAEAAGQANVVARRIADQGDAVVAGTAGGGVTEGDLGARVFLDRGIRFL